MCLWKTGGEKEKNGVRADSRLGSERSERTTRRAWP